MKAAAVFVALAIGAMLTPAQTPASGPELFAKRCGGCHAVDREKEGPRLGGVFGRTAGSVDSFTYSDALKKSGVKWDERTLDQWLTDPDKLVPGTDMAFHVESGAERAALIAYLKALPKQ